MVDKIFSGADVAKLRGAKSFRDYLIRLARQRSMLFTNQVTQQDAVQARIDFQRWVADCDCCGGSEYVDPDDPVFFCLTCGNQKYGGKLRKVIFPEAKAELEAAVLERQVNAPEVLDPIGQAMTVKLTDGISRSWNPGETVGDLREQHQVAMIIKEVKHGL